MQTLASDRAAFMIFVFWFFSSVGSTYTAEPMSSATKENLDLPFDAVGSSEDEEEAPEIVVFYGQQYEGDGFFFCCDRSGSMNDGVKWKRMQQEVVKNISQFSEKVEFSIVFFDAGMVCFPPSGRPAEASPALKAAGIAMVMSAVPGHGTCAKPALIKTINYANQSSSKRKTCIYLSDGHTTCDGQGSESAYANTILAEVTARNTQRAHINTICIGQTDVMEDFMRKLAAQNNGQYSRLVQ